MVIGGEGFFCVNLLCDLLCLLAAARLCGLPARPGRMLAAAALGAGLCMAALARFGAHGGGCAAPPLALLMALVAFGPRACPPGTGALLGCGLTAAGTAQYLRRLGLGAWGAALCCLPVCLGALRLLLRARSRAGARAEVRLLFESGGVTLNGLVDSGNLLRDPVTALPVVVASFSALRPHLPKGMACGDLRTLPAGFRLVSVRTAAGSRLLMCFRPRGLYIRSGSVWRAVRAVVAVSPDLDGDRALLPPTL